MPRTLTTEEFIERARVVHNDKYDYSKVEYVNYRSKVIITCPIHGDFEQVANSHIKGHGCPTCSGNVKLTTEEFIKKAHDVHGDEYDYSKVEYVNRKMKVIITCPIHGDFEQRPSCHLSGAGCLKCANLNKKLSTEEFIKKAHDVHGDEYDYSKVEYIYDAKKVVIVCPTHGDFEQTPRSHMNGRGCPICSGNKQSSTEEFIKKAHAVHDGKYDYSKVEYINNKTKVIITCPTHGDFEQIPYHHMNNFSGCPKCSADIRSSKRASTTEEFIEKAKAVHDDKYDYSKVEYINSKTKVIITCPTHGDFEQRPSNHRRGEGCPRCKKPRISYDKMTVEQRQRVKDVYTYHLRFKGNGELFDKIGISGDLPNRIGQIQHSCKKAYKFVSGRAYMYGNADIAYEMEYKLLEKQQLTKNNKYCPKIPFGGDTECIIPSGNPNMFDSTCIPERSDRFNYGDYKGE